MGFVTDGINRKSAGLRTGSFGFPADFFQKSAGFVSDCGLIRKFGRVIWLHAYSTVRIL